MADGSGSNPHQEEDPLSPSPSRRNTASRQEPFLVALIEDNPADAYLVEEAIAARGLPVSLVVVRDGEAAARLIDLADSDCNAPAPALFLLDLNIPAKNGEEVLAYIRSSKRCANTPVVVVTSSNSPQDRARAKELGANRYFRKPTDYDEFLRLGELIQEILS